MTSVTIEGISKSYQAGVPVLKPIDLEIPAGELFFLLGPSGCGKSTLLRILAGLVEPSSGSIRFNNREITRLPTEKRRTAMVFQNYALWPHLTVFENVAFGLRAAGTSKDIITQEVNSALELVQLFDCAQRKIPSLSGGQQQRVALARAMAMRPDLLLLDEPLSNLDARLRDTMRHEIRRITKERELTTIYVTHDRQEALSMADRLAVIHQGTLQQVGTPRDVYHLPENRFVASFLGDVNFLKGTVAENGYLQTNIGSFPLATTTFHPTPGQQITAAVRPERIRIVRSKTAQSFSAQLTASTFLGECCEWRFSVKDLELEVLECAPPTRRVGDICELEFDPGHLIALRG